MYTLLYLSMYPIFTFFLHCNFTCTLRLYVFIPSSGWSPLLPSSLYLASVRSASCHFLPLSISDLRIVFRRLGSVQFMAWSSIFFAEFGEKGGGGNKIDIFMPNIIDFNVLFSAPRIFKETGQILWSPEWDCVPRLPPDLKTSGSGYLLVSVSVCIVRNSGVAVGCMSQ